MNKYEVIVYHADCHDGFGAATVAYKHLIEKYGIDYANTVDFHAAHYGSKLPNIKGKHVLILDFSYDNDVMKYIQEKGYIAIDGISLTVGHISEGGFALHLIPETIQLTTIGGKGLGEHVNIEVDSMTQTIVSTVEKILEERV